MRIDGVETHPALTSIRAGRRAGAQCFSQMRLRICKAEQLLEYLAGRGVAVNRITDHHHDRGPVAARHRKIRQGCVRGWIPDPLDSSERSVEPASGIRNRKFNRAVDNTKSITVLRKHAQRVIDVDDIAVCLQQRNAIGQPPERILQHTSALADRSQAGRDVVCTLIVRAKSLHEGDFTLVNVALFACPLDADERCRLGRMFEQRTQEIAQSKMRQEFGVKWITSHAIFVQDLMIPDHVAGALSQYKWKAWIESSEMLDIRSTCGRGHTHCMERAVSLHRLVEDLKSRSGGPKHATR